MKRLPRWKILSSFLTSLLLPAAVSFVVAQAPANRAPVIDDPLKEGTVDKVAPKLPVGKGLVLPIAASDADGDALSYTVTSSNPKIHVRARTGQPHLKLGVRHVSSGAGDVAFAGELEFQILREWTPETAGFINGFAQSNYYLPRTVGETTQPVIFHRVIKGFMAQTGDPNGHTRNQKDQSNHEISHGPGFNFNDEFHPGLIFTGRGQMAMANAGFDGFYNGTNNSQWFVTVGPQRHLDFNHTIFGQIIRGWDLLDKMNDVRVQDQPTRTDLPAGTPDFPEANSSPITPIEITGASVVPNFTDAVLVITAEAPGTSTITVKVNDGRGGTASQSFTVTAEDDTHNSPPFLAYYPLDGPLSAAHGEAFPLQALDLENDYLFLSSLTLSGDAISQVVGNSLQVYPLKWSGSNSTAPTSGKHLIGMTVSAFDMTGTRSSNTEDQRASTFVIGEKPITAEGLPVSGAPGVALTAPVATFADSDARGDKSGYGARINWGDGSTPALVQAEDIVRDPTRPSLVAYQVKGTHTYSRPGTYTIKINLESTTGLKKTVRTIAVISENPVKVFGEALNAQGAKVANQVLATIEDSAPSSPSAYSTRINWGDGSTTTGTVKRAGSGQLFVTGSHDYRDTDSYSVLIEVTKEGIAAPATGWATVRATNAKASRYLPPFPRARIIGDITRVSTPKIVKPLLTTVGSGMNEQTMATLGVVVISHGAATVPPSKIRFYLSADRHLNLQDEEYEDTSVDPPVTRINPADIPITVGKKKNALGIIALKPGVGGQVNFDKTTADTRLYFPKREPGLGYYLIAHFDYKEPLVAPGERIAVEDLGSPISVIGPDTPRSNDGSQTVELMETPGSTYNVRSFIVRIARRPSAEVKIPLTITGIFGQQDPSEFYFTAKPPAEDKYLTESPDHEVIFTPAMWDQGTKEIAVSLTAKNDNVAETSDQKLHVHIGGAKSHDPLFQDRTAGPLVVYVRDVDANVTVSKTSLVTKKPNTHATFEVALRSPLPLAGKTVSIKMTSGNPAEGKLSIPDGTAEEKIAKDEITVVLSATTPKRTIRVETQNSTSGESVSPQYTITIHPTVSDDPNFHNVNPPDITVTSES